MPIDASPSGTLDIENATLRSREIVALTNMVAGNDVVRSLNPPTLEIYGDPEPTLELVSNVNDVSASAFARLTSNAGVFSIQSGVNQEIDSKGDIAFTSINGNSEHMRIVGSTGRIGIGTTNPTSNLHVMGDINLEHVSNVATLKVNSNVVTEYTGPHDRPLRKYPEVAMLSGQSGLSGGYTQDGYTVKVSNESSPTLASYAFNGKYGDNDATDAFWYTGNLNTYNGTPTGGYYVGTVNLGSDGGRTATVFGDWIELELPNKIKLDYFKYFSQTASVNGAQDGVLYARNTTNEDWTLVHSYTDALVSDQNTPYTFNVNSTNYYKIYALVITRRRPANTGTGGVSIGELEYYGYEEGSGSLDTTLKSVYNVPATTGTQLEVYYDGRETSSYSGSGTTVTDISPNTNNGTLNGGVGFDSTYKAFTFNGTTTRNITTTLPSSVTGEYVHSVSLWIKADEVSRSGSGVLTFFTIGSASATNMIALGVNTTGDGIKYDFFNAGAEVKSPQITNDEWMHFVVTYSGGANNLAGAKRIYLNGKELSVIYDGANVSSPLSLPTSPTLTLGGQINSSNPPFSGSIANFRLYSKVLSADQVKELYDYQKDYFLGSKSQVTLYKGHLGVGVTEPSGQLELAGDERIQQYPPRALTGYETLVEGHGVFCVYASTVRNSSWGGWEAFDGDTSNSSRWISLNTYTGTEDAYNGTARLYSSAPLGEYVVLKLPYPIKLSSARVYGLSASPDSNNNRQGPERGQIWGSNDGVIWEHVINYDFGDYQQEQWNEINNINSTKYYSQYGFIVTKKLNNTYTAGGATQGDYVAVTEIQYFGTPGPTTLDKGSLSLTRSLDVPRISRYDVDTETPRPEKLVVDFDTTVNSSPTDISGKGNHGAFYNGASYSPADKAFNFDGSNDSIRGIISNPSGDWVHSISFWFKLGIDQSAITVRADPFTIVRQGSGDVNRTTDLAEDDKVGHYSACDITPTTIDWYFYGNDARFNISGLKAGEWHHLIFAYEGGGAVASRHAYFDGVEYPNVGTSTTPLAMFQNSVLALGMDFGRVSSSPSYFNGQISNFKLYDVALEPSEVKKLYNLGRTGRSMVISDTAVGIGKVPEANLDVRGSLAVRGGTVMIEQDNIKVRLASDPGYLSQIWGGSMYIANPSTSGGYEHFIMNNSTTGSHQTTYFSFRRDNTQIGSILTSTGSTISFNTGSDYRLKENIVDMPDVGLEIINKLRPKTFNFKKYPGETVHGFIAHELQEHIPIAVSGEKDEMRGEEPMYQGVDASKIVPWLVKSIQELYEENQTLKTRLDTLEGA